MGFAVYHVEKGKSNGFSLGAHIDRTPGHERTFKNANPELKKYNASFKLRNDWNEIPLNKAIKDCIKKGYKGEKKIRSDAVTHLKHILTFSHEDKDRFWKDGELKKSWLKANIDFISEQFGASNVVRFTLHMDEKTPHIHCVTVPITKDGRLSAKEMIGDRKQMQQRQDRYAELMKPFGLDRGIKGSKAKHTSVDYYYGVLAKMEERKKVNVSYPEIEKPTFWEDKEAFKKRVDETVKNHIDALKVDFEAKLKDQLIHESKDILRNQRAFNLRAEISDLKDSNDKIDQERARYTNAYAKASEEVRDLKEKRISLLTDVKKMIYDKDPIAYDNVTAGIKNHFNKGKSRE